MGLLWAALGILLLCGILGAREFWVLHLPMAVAIVSIEKGRKDSARRILERVLRTPSLLGRNVKQEARFRLSWLLMERGEYALAVELLRVNLQRPMPAAQEANTLQRLAEALEGAGQSEEAEAVRQRVAQRIEAAPEDADRLLSEGQMLDQQQRFGEAYSAYERGLALIPTANRMARAKTMVRLALAAFNAGRPADAIRWGEQALTLDPQGVIRRLAHSAVALGNANLGRLEAGENHRLSALELATKSGNRDQIAQFTAQLAEIQGRRGHLAQAMQNCEQAKRLSIAERRLIYAVELECLKAWGRYEEAFETAELMLQAQTFPTPSAQKRMQAAIASELAVLKAELGRPDEALTYNRQALEGLQNDAKLTAQYRANGVWYLALQGRREEAEAETEQVETLLQAFSQSRGILLSSSNALGRAYFALKDYARSQAYWERYLACQPDPVYLPKAYYFLGECLLANADADGADSWFRKALEPGLDTYYTRCAQRRLGTKTNRANARTYSEAETSYIKENGNGNG